ncbi:MAG: GTPase HflX [Planctomycetes bacterium]|nr:GTPase HflX [Planctomycetota bacterium]
MFDTPRGRFRTERVILAGALPRERDVETPMKELADLVASACGKVIGTMTQSRPHPDPRTYLGKGKIRELRDLAENCDADLIVMDDDLTPVQVRNIEAALERRVIDRSELILHLFALRARTRQAQDQVELALLEYLRPRLRRMWTHLERIDGPIGMRGPGEKQIETDRRLADRRIKDLRDRIGKIQDRRKREVASREGIPSISLIGYTNAGKTSLWNRLTRGDGLVEDRPFSTLDTRTKRWYAEAGRPVLVSDTVGFIRKLPHRLIASFQATLEETLHADLLLHVVDAASPHPEADLDAVEKVLQELGCAEHPRWRILNKIDRLTDRSPLALLRGPGTALEISARTGEGGDALRQALSDWASAGRPARAGKAPDGAS